MDGSTEHAFPTPETTDSEEVRTELETGATLWLSDPREALRCLRRAAEGAADAGDDARSVYLARAAADLRSQASVTTSIAPSVDGAGDAVLASQLVAAQPLAVGTVSLVDGAASTSASAADSADAAASPRVLSQDPATPLTGGTAPGIPAAVRAVTSGGFAAATAGKSEASSSGPRYAGMNHDPAQTVPATPAASAAMALQEAAAQAVAAGHYQTTSAAAFPGAASPDNLMQTTWPTGVPMANIPSSGPVSEGADTQTAKHAPVSVAPTSIGRGFGGSSALNTPLPMNAAAGSYALSAAMAASNPTPVEVPIVRRQVAEAAARNALTGSGWGASPGVSPSINDTADTPVPSGLGRFVEHRALRVALSPTPNAAGHFEIHPLTQREAPEPGWKVALLVGIDETERLFPGRG
jgi:hypothetical protein